MGKTRILTVQTIVCQKYSDIYIHSLLRGFTRTGGIGHADNEINEEDKDSDCKKATVCQKCFDNLDSQGLV